MNGSTTWTYSYDYENRLTKVQKTLNGPVTVSQNTYNGDGTLVKAIEGSTQVFVSQGNNRIFAKNTGSGKAADYYYANGLLIASVNGSTSYYHDDALGSVRLEFLTHTNSIRLFSSLTMHDSL